MVQPLQPMPQNYPEPLAARRSSSGLPGPSPDRSTLSDCAQAPPQTRSTTSSARLPSPPETPAAPPTVPRADLSARLSARAPFAIVAGIVQSVVSYHQGVKASVEILSNDPYRLMKN